MTAPAKAVAAGIWCEGYQTTAGSLWFDNCVVKPVTTGVTIASGSITADKLSADAIDGKVITGADIRTGASGQRTEIVAAGPVYYLDGNQKAHYPPGVVWYTGDPSEVTAGELTQYLASSEYGSQATVRLSTPDVGYGTGSLMLQAGNHGGDVAGMLVRVAGMSLMINSIGGFVVGSTNELYVRADGSNNLYFGAVSIGLVQDWTTPGLASGYTANGNANGTQQFRVIDWLGTRFVQWRGGIGVTYSSGAIVNGGAPFSPALPSVARPSARRTVPVACSLTTYKAAVKMDFNADGTVSIIGTTTTENPAWISLNDVMYSL